MTPNKIESVRRTMQEQLDAQKAAVGLWRAEDPVNRERVIPQPWELTQFLMERLRMTQLVAKAILSHIPVEHKVVLEHMGLIRLWKRYL